MAINDILEIGRQGLVAQRQAMTTTSNNIANANTPGYTRQKAELRSNPQSMNGNTRLGGGVDVKAVVRIQNGFVEHQILEESRSFGNFKMRADGLHQLENTLSNQNFRIGDLVNRFFADVRDSSAEPEQASLRANVAHSASATAEGFRALNGSLDALKGDLDARLEHSVKEINTMTKELSELNGQIQHFVALGEAPNELYDRRDGIVRELSLRLGMQTTPNDQGHININAEGVGVLVNGTDASELCVRTTPAGDGKTAGSVDIFVRSTFGERAITPLLKDGELGGMIHVRDHVINTAMKHLDQVAFEFASKVNDIHKEGAGVDGGSGRGLFAEMQSADGAAGNLAVDEDVRTRGADVIAAGYSADAKGDNRVALALAELQSQALLPGAPELLGSGQVGSGNSLTFNESLNSLVGSIATKTQHEEELLKHQEAVMSQLDNYQKSISGVSLEEEAVNMMQYQTVFNASAKAMKVGDELFKTILSLKE